MHGRHSQNQGQTTTSFHGWDCTKLPLTNQHSLKGTLLKTKGKQPHPFTAGTSFYRKETRSLSFAEVNLSFLGSARKGCIEGPNGESDDFSSLVPWWMVRPVAPVATAPKASFCEPQIKPTPALGGRGGDTSGRSRPVEYSQ